MALKVGGEEKLLGIKDGLFGQRPGSALMLILLGRFLWQTFGPSPAPAAPAAPVVVSAPQTTTTPAAPGRAATKVGGSRSPRPYAAPGTHEAG